LALIKQFGFGKIRPFVSTSGLYQRIKLVLPWKIKETILMIKELHIFRFDYSGSGTDTFYSYSPVKTVITDPFYKVTADKARYAAEKAAIAFQVYSQKSGKEKAAFLTVIAEEILNTRDKLVSVCNA